MGRSKAGNGNGEFMGMRSVESTVKRNVEGEGVVMESVM